MMAQTVPRAPKLGVSPSGPTSVLLYWLQPTGASKYHVEKKVSNGVWTDVSRNVAATANSIVAFYTVDELQCATSYSFRIRAYGTTFAPTSHESAEIWGPESWIVTTQTRACADENS